MLFLLSDDLKKEISKCMAFIGWNILRASIKLLLFFLSFIIIIKLFNDGIFSLPIFLFMIFSVLGMQLVRSLGRVGEGGTQQINI